ncbi:hypothetical protein RM553_08195 [Zunongwangia sp. F363]|uniref:Lipoprotein n=1 Tax=Autumnicola tepida TaxID=3075595 RepID=A0ABU3C945_9FLAO|nr:hypothetical protein [Zunongwangia sp. F363]MDT0642808.1 hypothetical protein [Zunongwangia sp. F363]
MKIKSTIFLALLSLSFFGLCSCSDDDSDVDENNAIGCADFEDEYADVMDALTVYSENPNVQNCENYKESLITFYEEFSDCPFWGTEYQQAIDEVENMDCSEETQAGVMKSSHTLYQL